jgi:hypothetical protein
LDLTKKFVKQDVPLKPDGHAELCFCIRFYPVDVTQVLQYVTLYQTFLAARQVGLFVCFTMFIISGDPPSPLRA